MCAANSYLHMHVCSFTRICMRKSMCKHTPGRACVQTHTCTTCVSMHCQIPLRHLCLHLPHELRQRTCTRMHLRTYSRMHLRTHASPRLALHTRMHAFLQRVVKLRGEEWCVQKAQETLVHLKEFLQRPPTHIPVSYPPPAAASSSVCSVDRQL